MCYKTIEEFPSYEINRLAVVRVKSTKRIITNRIIHRDKYLMIRLRRNGRRYDRRVHRLLAMAFIPNPDSLPEVNHKDGNKLNNRLSNLEWSTPSSNMKHANQTGLSSNQPKISLDEVKQIRSLSASGSTDAKLASQFSLTELHINRIRRNLRWI